MAGQARVHAVLRLAGHDVAAVHQLELPLADVAELRRVLEAHLVPRRHGLAGRGLGQRSVARAPAALRVHHLVVLRLHLAHRHASIARRPPPRASARAAARSGASARRSAACCASRRCPGCRSASRRPWPAPRARASSRPRARRPRSWACPCARPAPSRTGGRRWRRCRPCRWPRRRADHPPSHWACRRRRTSAGRRRGRAREAGGEHETAERAHTLEETAAADIREQDGPVRRYVTCQSGNGKPGALISHLPAAPPPA